MGLLDILGRFFEIFVNLVPRPLVCAYSERVVCWVFGFIPVVLYPFVWWYIPALMPIIRVSLKSRSAELYEKSSTSLDRINISCDATIQWRVSNVWRFVHQVEDGHSTVVNVVQSTLQRLVASQSADSLAESTACGSLARTIIKRSNTQLRQYGIVVSWFGMTSEVRAKAIHLIGMPWNNVTVGKTE